MHQEITEYLRGNSHLHYSQLGSSTSMPTTKNQEIK